MAKRLPVLLLLLILCSSLAVPQIVPTRVRVSQGVMERLIIKKVQPDYPPDAIEQHIQGVVVLKVNIDKQGNVYKVELISGHPLLAPAAIAAVRQWKYKPYLLNGTPVEVETQAQVNFTLSGN
ncbi:MAG TPA: energy transducer TonB [Candidatus Sulfotelmatobacter sp.]|nr:energy transducer TonB [Candidatus Sulfotelmatobacter sp.]